MSSKQGISTKRGNKRSAKLARRDLRMSQERLRTVLDTVIDGIITIDRRGCILSVNSAAQRIFGYPQDEMVGEDVSLLMPEPHRSAHHSYIDHYLRTGEAQIIGVGREVIGKRRDGSEFPMSLAVSEFEIDGESLFTGIVRDVTALKKAQRALRESEERNRELQLAHGELERVAVAGEMAAVAAHEIRTPLNALSINAQLVQRILGRAEPDIEKAQRMLTTVQQEIERINSLLEDHLRLLRRPMGSAREPVALDAIVEEAVRIIGPHARRHRVSIAKRIACEISPLKSDPGKLRQVLLNLMLNAIQAMSATGGGALSIEISQRDGSIEVAVGDNGPGIAAEQHEQIFKPFITTKEKGTGLGLAISRRMVHDAGGRIEVESRLGHGATFTVCLPLPE